jgi:hypothetical protein
MWWCHRDGFTDHPKGYPGAMSTTVVVLLAGFVGGVSLLAIEAIRGSRRQLDDVADPLAAEHWLVTHLAERPRLRAAVEHTDRRVAGGLAVAISFMMVFIAALVVGWVFESIGTGRGFARWDRSVAQWGPDHAAAAAVDFMRAVTRLGDTWLVMSALAIAGVVDWRRRRTATPLWFLVTVGVGVTLINNGLKLLIMRERPPVDHLVGSGGGRRSPRATPRRRPRAGWRSPSSWDVGSRDEFGPGSPSAPW